MLQSIFAIAAAQTDVQIISALANHKVEVYEFRLGAAGTATDFTFGSKSGVAASTIAYPPLRLGATATLALPQAEGRRAEVQTNAGEALVATTGSGATVNGLIRYLYKAVL